MRISKKKATGRARCNICLQFISAGRADIIISTYNEMRHNHFNCIRTLPFKEEDE